jgi:ATP-dependent RNA helicase DHX57
MIRSMRYFVEGAILVFVKGVPDINRTIMLLEQCITQIKTKAKSVVILPLHSNLSPNEQKKVFNLARSNEIKVVISTNIAEASVTIPDVTIVIDTCRVKELAYDSERQMTSLESKLCAQDALKQRRGRAGRVKQGRCFKLITLNTFNKLPLNSVPEILRIPLDRLVLQTMSMGLEEDFSSTLAHCVDPPHPDALASAYSNLVKLQAIDDSRRKLSLLGEHMSALPCAPKVSRLLLYGTLFSTVLPAATVAAILSSKSMYLTSNENKKSIEASKRR